MATIGAKIRLFVPAQEAKMGPPLAPILGQHQINLMEFCKEFNKQSTEYASGVLLPVRVRKLEGNKFVLYIRPPTIHFVLQQINGSDSISVLQIYDVFRFVEKGLAADSFQAAKIFFGFLKSKKLSTIKLSS